MSLRLLQKSATVDGKGEDRARGGRGRGRQNRRMSLQEFTQQSSVPIRGMPSTSAWSGAGGSTASTAPSAALEPTPLEARSRPRGARGAPAPRQSAWGRGAPKSIVDARQENSISASIAQDELSWEDAPECEEESNDWGEPAAAPDVVNSWDDSPVVTSMSNDWDSTNPDEDELDRVLKSWLQELQLERHHEDVLRWCQEQGASSVDEVLEVLDDLVESIGFTEEEQRHLYHNAEDALERVNAASESATPTHLRPFDDNTSSGRGRGRGRGEGAVNCASTAFPATPSSSSTFVAGSFYARNQSCSDPQHIEEQPSKSFYGSHASAVETLEESRHDDDVAGNGSFYSSEPGSFYAKQHAQSQKSEEIAEPQKEEPEKSSRQIVKALTNRELVTHYTKDSATRTATFEPTKKVSQAEKRKERQSKAEAVSQSSSTNEAKLLAKQAFERQLQASDSLSAALKKRDGESVRELLSQGLLDKAETEKGESLLVELASEELEVALEARDEDAVRRLLNEGRLNHRDRNAGEAMLAKEAHLRRARVALGAIKSASEAPFDDTFGSRARKALQDAGLARIAEDGPEAVDELQEKLEVWEKREEATACLVLVLHNRQSNAEAVKVAIAQAEACGLSGEDPLVLEALQKLGQLEREQRAAEEKRRAQIEHANRAEERLQLQLQKADDADELELAIEECEGLRVQIGDARNVLDALREAESCRKAAAQSLQDFLEVDDAEAIKAAIRTAREAGVEESLLQAAEARTVALKRRHNATVELVLAQREPVLSQRISRLKAAIPEAQISGVEESAVEVALKELQKAASEEERQHQACETLRQATRRRDLTAIQEALQATEGVLTPPCGNEEVSLARALLNELQEETREQERRAAVISTEAELSDAIERSNFRAIQVARRKLVELDVPEDTEVLLKAASKLDALRDEHEESEAKDCVEATEARIAVLRGREAQLSGQANKKERVAVGKEIMALKNDDEYLSNLRFLRDRDEERKRRELHRAKTERREAEKAQEMEQRHRKALEELKLAMERLDEATVRSLLDEGALDVEEMTSAETWLRDQAPRLASAREDAAILEFSYRHLQKREFFKASVAMNDFFSKEYDLREGSCFKLRSVHSCHSVLVAFRSPEYAEAIMKRMQDLTQRGSCPVVSSAEVHAAANFSAEVEDSLADARQDAENLRTLPSRAASDKALGISPETSEGASNCRGNAGSIDDMHEDEAVPQRIRETGNGQSCTRYYTGKGKAESQRAGATANGVSHYVAKGKAALNRAETVAGVSSSHPEKGKAAIQRSSTVADGRTSSGYLGKGKGWSQSYNACAEEFQAETIALSHQAVAILATDREQARLFSEDLRLFANRFPFVAEYDGSSQVILRPTTSVCTEERSKARTELGCLIDYYFPAIQEKRYRNAHLCVSEDRGACISLVHDSDGYLVDAVEDYPGQEFWSGEVIAEINGHPLGGLVEEEMEEVFGNEFADGASLLILSRGSDSA